MEAVQNTRDSKRQDVKMKIGRPLITIGIPTYNRAHGTLPLTLESALAQDYPHLEIIVSDNYSADDTGKVVTSYRDPRLKYIRQQVNIGSNGNYNALLHAARGSYFLLLHDDDLIDNDFLSTCMERAGYQTSYGFVRTGTRMLDGSGEVIRERVNTVLTNEAEDLYRAWLMGKTGFFLCSTLFNKEAIAASGGFKSKNNLFEDGIAIIKIANKWPILNIPEIKASFRQHENQRTHAATATRWSEDFKQAIDLIASYNTRDKEALYQMGMENFSKVSLQFAKNVKNPIKRAAAIFGISRHFPYTYWPRRSRKVTFIGMLGTKFYQNAG